jgi:uncharacterized protein (DUF1810 family)
MNLQRFTDAQEFVYATALSEVLAGQKTTHWMWFVFPQFRDIGYSPTAQLYAIQSVEEARFYLSHPVLAPRLYEITIATLEVGRTGKSATEIFGTPDDLKLKSSMTLFDHIRPDSVFAEVLDLFYDGQRCEKTLELVK